jgi:adenylate cyclase
VDPFLQALDAGIMLFGDLGLDSRKIRQLGPGNSHSCQQGCGQRDSDLCGIMLHGVLLDEFIATDDGSAVAGFAGPGKPQEHARCDSDITVATGHNSAMPNFVTELKRRNVVRLGVAYTVVAWVIAQALDLAADNFAAPEWFMKIALAALIAGLPIALILAWAFEMTPDGVKKTEDVPVSQSITPRTGRRLNYVTTTALVLALAFIAWDKLGSDNDPVDGPVTDKSVAVLPFSDLSELQDQEWFADGLTEEILNSLARLPELRVTARTSSFEFKNTNTDISEIGSRLGVAHVVEGSVRRIGDKLRVTAQLIRAHDGFHLWSEIYDRNTDAIFDVQQDVAENIAASLDVILDDDKRRQMFASGTRHVAAFEAYLKGRNLYQLAHQRDTATLVTLEDANEYLGKAMELDPGFAQPAILHSDRYAHVLIEWGALIVGDSSDLDQDRAYTLLIDDLNFAINSAPDPASRIVAELNRELFSPHWNRMPGLLVQLKALVEAETLIPESTLWLAEILMLNREFEIAEYFAYRRQKDDPLNIGGWLDEADIRIQQGNFASADALLEYSRNTFGTTATLNERAVLSALMAGDRERAVALLQNDFDFSGDYSYYAPLLAAIQGNRDAALKLADEIESAAEYPDNGLLLTYAELQDTERLRSLVSRIDALKIGPTILALDIAINGQVFRFDIDDAPNLKKRLQEARIAPEKLTPATAR